MRRTTEQPSQNFLTDERTFMPLCCWSNDFNAVDDCDAGVSVDEEASEGDLSGALLSKADEQADEEQRRTCAGAVAAVRLERARRAK